MSREVAQEPCRSLCDQFAEFTEVGCGGWRLHPGNNSLVYVDCADSGDTVCNFWAKGTQALSAGNS